MPIQQEEKSISQLLTDVSDNMSRLLRQELRLVRIETEEKVSRTFRAGSWIIAGGLVLYMSVWAFLAALILVLAAFMPAWVACLLVGILTGVGGYMILQTGTERMKHINPIPETTAETLQENAEWIRDESSRRQKP